MRNLSAIWVNGDYYCFVSNLNFPNHTEIQRPSSYLLYKNTNKNPKNLQDFWRISWCYSFFIGLPYLNDFQNIALSCALILRSEGKTDSMNEWMNECLFLLGSITFITAQIVILDIVIFTKIKYWWILFQEFLGESCPQFSKSCACDKALFLGWF